MLSWLLGARKKPIIEERFFYHSFPRRGRDTATEIEKGCKILSLICDAGLLLAPEVVSWSYPNVDGSPGREASVIQRRICFTELSPRELSQHAKTFGNFALEFDINTLKGMGAMPVFYIPQGIKTGDEINYLGLTLVLQAMDAMLLVERLADLKDTLDGAPLHGRFYYIPPAQNTRKFDLDISETRTTLEAFSHALTPFDMLKHGLTGLLCCFYPADDLRENKALAYYRQREWRITSNFAVRGEEVMRLPSQEMVSRLLEIDEAFHGRDFPGASGIRRLAEEAYILPSIMGKRIIELVNRFVVPRAALAPAKAILARALPNAQIVCAEKI
jgi:hypothetical protein